MKDVRYELNTSPLQERRMGFAAALAVLITEASQSRQHGKSEPDVRYELNTSPLQERRMGFAAALAVLITEASQSRQHGKSEPSEVFSVFSATKELFQIPH
uniref:Uncharacterized protein n=1 Tax=Tanacetum cinerariifolium TaxID=118510 RepID=A0A699J2X8_TANCI|nr:hypothetical protein [Tanacetum cinerariifolium]